MLVVPRSPRFVSETPGTMLALRCPCGEIIDCDPDVGFSERVRVVCPSCRRLRNFDSTGMSLDI
jgi:hypothetical protein